MLNSLLIFNRKMLSSSMLSLDGGLVSDVGLESR